jgi:diphthine-ammonia ligase
MYQTVGHDLIDAYAECLVNFQYPYEEQFQAPPVPMYRKYIQHKPLELELNYVPSSSATSSEVDEVEDLFLLLNEVIQCQPEVEAVAVGAILSTYQRIRVENVYGAFKCPEKFI